MKYVPNKIPHGERIFNLVASAFLLIYGGHGIYTNDLYIPFIRSQSVHLQDEAAMLMFSAFICGCLIMLSVVVDHYDERDNEHKYRAFSKAFKYIGWGFVILSLGINSAHLYT